jgi:hypothetical protein
MRPLKLFCSLSETLKSPIESDRVTKYRFVPAPHSGPEGKPDTWSVDDVIWIYGAIGQYQVGQQYEFNLSRNEA